MMSKLIKDENGNSTMVEAAIWVPFSVLLVLGIYFIALFMCMKANLQANLQTALIYFKNPVSDTYVGVTENGLTRSFADGTYGAMGSTYTRAENGDYLFPYRGLWAGSSFLSPEDEFDTYFKEMAGFLFFAKTGTVTTTLETNNYIIFKTMKATATQVLVPSINMSMFGFDNEMVITTECKVVINNTDNFIRDTDFVIDLIMQSPARDFIEKAIGHVKELYGKFKNALLGGSSGDGGNGE